MASWDSSWQHMWGKSLISLFLRHWRRCSWKCAWLYSNLAGSLPLHKLYANAYEHRPHSEPPTCCCTSGKVRKMYVWESFISDATTSLVLSGISPVHILSKICTSFDLQLILILLHRSSDYCNNLVSEQSSLPPLQRYMYHFSLHLVVQIHKEIFLSSRLVLHWSIFR